MRVAIGLERTRENVGAAMWLSAEVAFATCVRYFERWRRWVPFLLSDHPLTVKLSRTGCCLMTSACQSSNPLRASNVVLKF